MKICFFGDFWEMVIFEYFSFIYYIFIIVIVRLYFRDVRMKLEVIRKLSFLE